MDPIETLRLVRDWYESDEKRFPIGLVRLALERAGAAAEPRPLPAERPKLRRAA